MTKTAGNVLSPDHYTAYQAVSIYMYMAAIIYTLCSKKTCDHVFDDKLKWNCPFRKIFGTLITKSTRHRQVFLFSNLTYLVNLLYLGKLSRSKYQ